VDLKTLERLNRGFLIHAKYRRVLPRLETAGLAWATFQVLRRTHASVGHEAIPRSRPIKRGHGIGAAIDVYTKTALSRRRKRRNKLGKAVLTA